MIIAALIPFGIAFALSFGILMFALRPASTSKAMRQRLTTIQHPVNASKADTGGTQLEKAEARDYAVRLGVFLQQYSFSRRLELLIVHANSSANVGTIVILSSVSGIAVLLIGIAFVHVIYVLAALMLVGGAIPYGYLKFRRTRRLNAFNKVLPDAIDLMARALRAGHSMASSIELIADQSPKPLGGEFEQVYQQQKFGLRFRDALLQMGNRVPSRDLQFLITAILVQKETGGDLTEILDRTSHVIRERVRIEGEVRTHTAQGRLTGWILGLLPVIMLVLINIVDPGYSSMLFHDPTGQKLLYAGGTLIVIGGLVIRKVVDVQV